MRFHALLLAVALGATAVGCGTGPADNPVDVQAPSAVEDMKTVLQGVIESGQPLGSGGYTLQQNIEELKKTDPDKAAKLQPLVDEMITINESGRAKAKAQEMLDILNS